MLAEDIISNQTITIVFHWISKKKIFDCFVSFFSIWLVYFASSIALAFSLMLVQIKFDKVKFFFKSDVADKD